MGGVRILAVSHGGMAEGMVRAAGMVAGNLDFLDCLCLDENSSIEQFRERLSKKLDGMRDAEQILVLTDRQGGSPFTSSAELLAQKGLTEKSVIISGMNLGLMAALALRGETVSEDSLEEILKEARESIRRFRYEEEEDEEL